jgi:hypothetical protein
MYLCTYVSIYPTSLIKVPLVVLGEGPSLWAWAVVHSDAPSEHTLPPG